MASVEKHGKKFRGTYTDENGRRRKTRVFPTKRAARQCAEEQEARLRSGTWRDPSTGKRTLTEYVEDPDHGWLRLRREERTTRDGYRSHWNQIKPVLEHYELRRLRSSVIQAWVNEQEAAGVTPITIKARFTFLQTVLAAKSGVSAIRDGELRLRAQLTRPSRAGPAKDTGEGRGLPPIGRCHGGGADQQDQPDSPNPTRSAHSTAHDRHYVVILGGGQHARAVLLTVPVSVKVPSSSSRVRWY